MEILVLLWEMPCPIRHQIQLVISVFQVSFQSRYQLGFGLETIIYEDALRLVVNATDILRENFVTSAILSLQCRYLNYLYLMRKT